MKILLDGRIVSADGIGRFTRNVVYSLINDKNYGDYYIVSRENVNNCKCFADCSDRYTWNELSELNRAINTLQPDLIHCFDFKVPLIKPDIPLFVNIHDIFRYTDSSLCYSDNIFIQKYGEKCYDDICGIVNYYKNQHNIFSIEKNICSCEYMHYKYYKCLLMWALYSSDKIIVPSYHVKNEILKCFDIRVEKITVIPYGVGHYEINNVDFNINETKEDFFIYVGQNRKHKNVETIIRAMSIFSKKYSNFKLKLIGADFREDKRNEIDIANLKDKLELCGYLSDEELRKEYSLSKALIHVSHQEGFGLTTVEAMLAGCIVITGLTSITREILGEFPIYIQNLDDAYELAEAMEMSLHASVCQLKAAREFVKKYTWESFTNQIKELYRGEEEHGIVSKRM